jgi:hypothetical protein
MSELFILQNHEKLFLSKQNIWVDGYDANLVYKTAHKDEAINQMVEASSKDYKQRIKIISCTASEKGLPVIDADIMPMPQPKAGKDLFADQETAELATPTSPAMHADESDLEEEPELEFSEESLQPQDDQQEPLL